MRRSASVRMTRGFLFQAANKAIVQRCDSFEGFAGDKLPVETATRYKYDIKTEVIKLELNML